jgi:hypothetical protein
METELARSDLDAPARGIELSSSGIRAQGISTLSLTTTLYTRSGQTVILGGLTEGSGDNWQKVVALLTPHVIE